jgi:hypothetical protein
MKISIALVIWAVITSLGMLFVLFPLFSGWRFLAQRYQTSELPGELQSFQSGRVGLVAFKSVLNVGTSDRGLYLSVFFPFSLAHPPLLIPWSEISRVEEVNNFFQDSYRLYIGTPPIAKLLLHRKTLSAVQSIMASKINIGS